MRDSEFRTLAARLERARREIDLLTHLLDAVDASVISTGIDGVVTHWTRGAERMFGWTRDEARGSQLGEVLVSDSDPAFVATTTGHARAAGQWAGEWAARRKDGSSFRAYTRILRVDDPEAGSTQLVGVSIDISHRVEMERQLRAGRDYLRAVTDSMGEGLYTVDTAGRLMYANRAAERLLGWTFDELAGRVMHDVVHFRRADGTDHALADCPLMLGARAGTAARVIDDILIRKDGTPLPVNITATPFTTEDGVAGSAVVFADITQQKQEERRLRHKILGLSWAGRVREALAHDHFVLHAQPIVDLSTGATVQHELLIRMREPDGSLVAPQSFLPAAEACGLVVDIDSWVVEQAIGLAARGHAVELNLSARSISAPSLLDRMRSELARTGADPALLVVELTETALMVDDSAAELFIERMRAMGCKLALDDFGTGYGGFFYLKRLPVDYLKIDAEFVRDLTSNQASRHVVEAVVSLARGFGQKTVAEGVEDDATLRLLRTLGVDLAQGFGIARPMPVEQALAAAPFAEGRGLQLAG